MRNLPRHPSVKTFAGVRLYFIGTKIFSEGAETFGIDIEANSGELHAMGAN